MLDQNPITFIDLQSQQKNIRQHIDARIHEVLNHGAYIMGPEIYALEHDLSSFCGAKHTITCANGTDALGMVLMAKGIGPTDAVFVPTFTFAATAEVVVWMGAVPIFIDSVEDTFNMCPHSLERGIEQAKKMGLSPKAVIAVDLFGLPADYDAIMDLCEKHNLWLMDDAAQGFGGVYKGKKIGTFGTATTTSFFPAKPLGCYGDGGAIFTDDDELADLLRSIRVHGQGRHKYENMHVGINGRLDTIQAAILLEKLKIFPDEITARNRIAQTYNEGLKNYVTEPRIFKDHTSTWAQYTIILPDFIDRNDFSMNLKEHGIPTAIYYPCPLHQQAAYACFPCATDSLPIAEYHAKHVISLPMHPYLTQTQQDFIIDKVQTYISNKQR